MKNIYRKLLEGLDDCCFEVINSHTCDVDIVDQVDTTVYYSDRYGSGATKLVLFPRAELNLDIVVKIPFTHSENMEEFQNEDGDWVYGDYYPLSGAGYGEGWNYIEAEMYIYEKAKEYGVEEAFLENIYIGTADNHPIYVQQKVEVVDRYSLSERHSQRSEELCKKISKDIYNPFEFDWACDYIEYFGEIAFEKLLNFCEEEYLSDFHMGNLGYLNEIPIILDYGGYES